jgi:hypothetical protein
MYLDASLDQGVRAASELLAPELIAALLTGALARSSRCTITGTKTLMVGAQKLLARS